MRRWILPLLMGTALQAGIMDFQTLSEAKKAYERGDYAAAAEGYAEVRGKNDAARYDYANALYRQKKYAEAAGIYAKISEPSLRQKALHNLGNSLAMSGKTDDAIKAYEEALTLGDDEETRSNLELLKKQKEQQQQQKKNDRKQNDQEQKKNDQNQSKQDDQNRSQQNDQQKRKQDQQQNGQNQDKQNQQKDQNGQNSSSQNGDNDQRQGQSQEGQEQPREKQQPEEAHSSEASEGKQEQTGSAEDKAQDKKDGEAAQAAVADPISDMEERKYNQMLDKRGVKTLMVPLSGKGEPNEDETTPW